MLTYTIGIDWADDHHDVCILDSQGQQKFVFRISQDETGFGLLLKQIQDLGVDSGKLGFALETNQGLLVEFLLGKNLVVYPINPKSADRFREGQSCSNKKDDRLDAFCLAESLRVYQHHLKPLSQESDLARELKAMVSHRRHLIEMKTRVMNQLTRCLKDYYPLALKIFAQIDSPIALAFFRQFPKATDVKGMSFEVFQSFMAQNHYPWQMLEKSPEQFYEEILGSKLFLPVDPVTVKTKSQWMSSLVEQLDLLMKQVRHYDGFIKQLMEDHPDTHIFKSLPGAGPTLSAEMSAHFGQNRHSFQSFESVQRLAGTAPITKQSGQYKHVQMRNACQTDFRQTMTQYAFVSLKHCIWAKSYYQDKKKKGATHAGALRALANKWLKIIYTLWSKECCYQEAIFLASRQQHQLLNAS